MKLLAVNPNTSGVVLDVILRSARRAASPGTEITGCVRRAGPGTSTAPTVTT